LSCSAPELKTAGEKPLYHIYLSFDDGPLEGSEDIDSAIRAEKVKINVFVIGSYVQIFPQMRKYFQLYENNPYIEIGNHSYSHAYNEYTNFYKDTESAYQDFVKSENVLKLKKKLARLPGRNMWRIGERIINDMTSGSVAADLLAKNGYAVFGWDIEWEHDALTGKPVQMANDIFYQIEQMLKKNKTVTKNHIVILCHDEMFRKKWEETELKELIKHLRWTGMYEFNHLSEYPRQQENGQ
jgi:peptidoglycan/xylan/chitin deacetylase (PgdA/CDA1 family)